MNTKTEEAEMPVLPSGNRVIVDSLSRIQEREKGLLVEVAQVHWQLMQTLRKSVNPQLTATAFVRGLLLSDELWQGAIEDAIVDYTDAGEIIVARMNSYYSSNGRQGPQVDEGEEER